MLVEPDRLHLRDFVLVGGSFHKCCAKQRELVRPAVLTDHHLICSWGRAQSMSATELRFRWSVIQVHVHTHTHEHANVRIRHGMAGLGAAVQ